ncbi:MULTISPECIES: hypothetical protein [Capnocytophaga]|uniref:Lipoprotein n=1 Tax=Capnocytophaga canis TaxID=1848903 RepID=A0A0B7I4M4_9FLAO|nr:MULTISPECIES: hypothetical protein [Capnocytophaga]ATA73023.1 hypothetical protein CGC49_06870 [Capnocytophaga sp. H4358]ATA75120.1 hypothetical protein CGC52_06625 [Capnocytophaga sp. H2931]RIY37008.1 hypothetical protein CKY20_05660 [Capnocytophaga canis]CEN44238.1 conserved exported hypothetical protein [Capnocytophaga canis]CEN45694.1 conserved exported hypothetical protein [Capnocytophaga canis]
MKKILVSLSVIALSGIVSCENVKQIKKETQNSVENVVETLQTETEKAVDQVKKSISEFEVPSFQDSDLQKMAADYKAYLLELEEATKAGSQEKIDQLKAKSEEWAKKIEEQGKKVSSEDLKKWSEWAEQFVQ